MTTITKTRSQRVNIMMRQDRLAIIDRARGQKNRSQFIDDAVKHYIEARGRARLHTLLEEEGRVNRERDLGLLAEWASVDKEAWRAQKK